MKGNLLLQGQFVKNLSGRIYNNLTVGSRRANSEEGNYSLSAGSNNTASGQYSLAVGTACEATGAGAIALGDNAKAGTFASAGIGYRVDASAGNYAYAIGRYLTAPKGQMVLGHFNNTTQYTSGDDYPVVIASGRVGKVVSAIALDTDGNAYVAGSVLNAGADYAEMREWLDGNPEDEDRAGYFVTLQGQKITPAKFGDYIAGITSVNPSMIGNEYTEWQGKYLTDVFNRCIEDEKGNRIINPDYDATQEYKPRSARKEWQAVGLKGRLRVYDDGTCKVDSYCNARKDGIATYFKSNYYFDGSNIVKNYRVTARITDNVIEVEL